MNEDNQLFIKQKEREEKNQLFKKWFFYLCFVYVSSKHVNQHYIWNNFGCVEAG